MTVKARVKRIAYQVLLFSVVLALAAGLALYTTETMETAKATIRVCLDSVIPSLFPFMVVSSLFVNLGLASYAGVALEGLMRRLFGVNGACAPAYALGLIGGYPVGVKTLVSLYEKKLCTKEEAERLLAFCNNSGPAFILGVVGAGVFKSPACGLLLLLTHILASLTVGILFRFYRRGGGAREVRRRADFSFVRFSAVFIDSVKNGFSSVLNVCAFVIFFSVFAKLLSIFRILDFGSDALLIPLAPLGVDPAGCESLLTGFFEMTCGLWALTASSAGMSVKLVLAAVMLGFGGISVHFQAFSFLTLTDLSRKPYLIGKTLHGLIAGIYTFLLLPLASPAPSVFAPATGYPDLGAMAQSDLFFCSAAAALLLWFLLMTPTFLYFYKKHFQKRS